MAEAELPSISIRYATEADLPTLARLELDIFPHSRYIRNTYQDASREAIVTFKSTMLSTAFSKSRAHFLVATDTTTDQIVAYCCWSIPDKYGYGDRARTILSDSAADRARNLFDFAPKSMDRKIYDMFNTCLAEKKNLHHQEGDMILNMVCVLPEYQGKGIGTTFLAWGIKKADAVGARIYLESTPIACQLYLRYGWQLVEECVIDYTQTGGDGQQTFLLMVRPPRSVDGLPVDC